MNKLTKILAAVIFFTTPTISVVACGKKSNDNENNDANITTDLQKEMLDGAEIMSRFILASRHENLNYNLNEILSMYLTPIPTALMMPVAYKYKNQNINFNTKINSFKNLLEPNLNKINNDNYSGVFASYLMGMYDDSFYENFINNGYFEDSFDEYGHTGFNKSSNNEMGILAGLDKELKLSENQSRRNLAWAIQDTGALTNYLLDKGYDGAFPGDTNGTTSPQSSSIDKTGGTNGSGYLYYNSIISSGKGTKNGLKIANNSVTEKLSESNTFEAANLKNNDFSSKINGILFNKTGSMIANTAGSLNMKGYINNMSSLLESVNESDFGAESLLTLSNYITPLLIDSSRTSDLIMQAVAFSLLINSISSINTIQNKDSKIYNYLKSKNFNEEVLNTKINHSDPIDSKLLTSLKISSTIESSIEKIKTIRLYSQSENESEPLKNLKNISDFLLELKSFQSQLSDDDKKEFANLLFLDDDSPFKTNYNLIIKANISGFDFGGVGEDGWKAMIKEDASGAINLLNLIGSAFDGLSSNESMELVKSIDKNNDYKNKSVSDLTRKQKQTLIKNLGYDYSNKKYIDDSFFKNYNQLLTNTGIPGVNELKDLFEFFKKSTNDSMQLVHEQALQYIYDDKYWKMTNKNISSTDPTELGGKIEFTLEYTGNGDSDSNASNQLTKIDVPENFNPYQTKVDHQQKFLKNNNLTDKIDSKRKSGIVLGKSLLGYEDKDLIEYDGKGENYKKVKNTYKIIWENISKNSDTPHWIVTDIKCTNENGEEFYNIY
ncbi:hypothetical protein [Spiroplasma turonicum]|uniref:Lipoprotein n=1 Tax=Spiroplasma turonicum TaxID=216946 RepID=A0A0K1P6U8_9MOLU|nr:hypothetical protein [Spiroplasma turonicum]AKU79995.1 hypothetical protein STURON_00749 [Spiroplasma turonicum]ALX70997.1 hypothetical protein STURO_v1c07460 [Spiroplasma turonicum]